MARRSRSQGPKAGGLLLFFLGLFLGAGILYLLMRPAAVPAGAAAVAPPPAATTRAPRRPPRPKAATPPSDHIEPEGAAGAVLPASTETVRPTGHQGARIALVIDDLGHDVADLRPLEALGVPVTYSVLPFEQQTPEVVAELRRRKAEILLHLPMEPVHGQNPGPGALLQGMSDGELREKTEEALEAVPGAVGVNNHMGSLLSSEEGPMNAVLSVLAEHNLFFLDSRTSAQSVGYKVALERGVPAAERQVFLDGDESPEAIHAQFQRLLAVARARGSAIAIGHPHPETLAALTREVPRAKAEGFELVPVSYLLTRAGGE